METSSTHKHFLSETDSFQCTWFDIVNKETLKAKTQEF